LKLIKRIKERMKKMYSEKLHILYSLLNVIRISKPKRMRWAENITLF
jgi:hypothetical protein